MRDVTASAIRYGIAGLTVSAVYFVAVGILVREFHMSPVHAAGTATIAVVLTSYLVNRFWVFDTDRPHRSAFARFAIVSAVGFFLNTRLMHLAVDVMGWGVVAGLGLSTLVLPPTNFAINYLWSFRRISDL